MQKNTTINTHEPERVNTNILNIKSWKEKKEKKKRNKTGFKWCFCLFNVLQLKSSSHFKPFKINIKTKSVMQVTFSMTPKNSKSRNKTDFYCSLLSLLVLYTSLKLLVSLVLEDIQINNKWEKKKMPTKLKFFCDQ